MTTYGTMGAPDGVRLREWGYDMDWTASVTTNCVSGMVAGCGGALGHCQLSAQNLRE